MIFVVRCTNLFGIIMLAVVAMATITHFRLPVCILVLPVCILSRMVCIDFELVCSKNGHKNDGA